MKSNINKKRIKIKSKKKRQRKSRVISSPLVTSATAIGDNLIKLGSFSLDSFLVDEQNNCPEELNLECPADQGNFKPLITDLDKLILEPRQKNDFKEIIPTSSLKVSLTKEGGVVKEMTPQFFGSVHQVNLKKNKKSLSELKLPVKETPQFSEAATPVEENFKINNHQFVIPQTSLVSHRRWLGWLKQRVVSLKLKSSSRQKSPVACGFSYPWWLRFKMTLNFSLIALLLILPIRALFFYQHLELTKGKVLGISEEAFNDLEQGALAASQANWDEAEIYFSSANSRFNQARDNLIIYNQTLINIAKSLPATGDLIKSGENLLVAGEHLSTAAGSLAIVLNQLKESQDINQTITDRLALISQALTNTRQEILVASSNLLSVKPIIIPVKYRDYFAAMQKKLPEFTRGLTETQSFLDFSLELLGHQSTKRYLFLFQNNNELRATGGFLGSAALVDIKMGKIVKLEVPPGGLYDLKGDFFEKVISPSPMHLVGVPWMIWDANWWPDFPTTAKKISWFWEKSGWPSVDGIITFNASLLPKLLALVGEINLPAYNQLLTADNVILALQHETEFEYDKTTNQPKKIIADLMPIIINKLLEISPQQLLPLLLTFNQALTEKEIQFYFFSDDLQRQVEQRKWAGAILETTRDYLLVVNQNVAGGKSDAVIKQQIDHYAYLQPDGSIIDTVAITRTHQGNPGDVFERAQNNSYIRIYVPLGSQLLEVSGYDVIDPQLFKEVYPGYQPDEDLLKISGAIFKDAKTNSDIYSEFNKTVFGNWLTVKPGESKTITFSYRLPFTLNFTASSWWQAVNPEKYSLLVQSQSGAKQTNFSSQLSVPENLEIIWSASTLLDNLTQSKNNLKFDVTLSSDQYYGALISSR